MIRNVHVLLTYCILVLFANTCFALDPSDFCQVLGIEVNGNRGTTKDLTLVQKALGNAGRTYSGDAATGEGRIEYLLYDHSQSIVFRIGECYEGYTVERIGDKSEVAGIMALKPSIKTISAGVLKLGLSRKEVEKLFSEPVSGGWEPEEDFRDSGKQRIVYKKKVFSESGMYFCHHIRILLYFNADSELNKFDVTSGGCDDSPCE